MNQGIWLQVSRSPILVRVLPFAVFIIITNCQGQFGEASRYWLYAAKTAVVGWLVWQLRPFIAELKWRFSWEACLVGVAVFIMWVGLDGWYPALSDITRQWIHPLLGQMGFHPKAGPPVVLWNPHAQFGEDSALAWFIIGMRIFGSCVVVPPMEEVFYRSFFYRYFVKADFQSVPLGRWHGGAFLLTAVVFGLTHFEWLSGILCAFAYQGLVLWKQRLDDAVAAHSITNLLLAIWVLGKGAWHFW